MSKVLCIFGILICFLFSASPAFSKAFDTGGISEKSTEFGADEITAQGNKINHFIFNVLLKIAAGVAGGGDSQHSCRLNYFFKPPLVTDLEHFYTFPDLIELF